MGKADFSTVDSSLRVLPRYRIEIIYSHILQNNIRKLVHRSLGVKRTPERALVSEAGNFKLAIVLILLGGFVDCSPSCSFARKS